MVYKRNPIESEQALKTLRISPSSINSFRNCPRRWHYEYVLAETSGQTIHTVRGTVVHNILEEMFKFKTVPSGESFRPFFMDKSQSMLDEEWDKAMEELPDVTPEEKTIFYKETKFMLKRFFTRFCDNVQNGINIKKFADARQGYYFTRPIFKELWLDDQFKCAFTDKWKRKFTKERIPLDNPMNVGGFIDSVQKDFDNNMILVDYKTSNKYKNALSEEYVLQLSIYAYLWERQTGKMPAYVAINYLKFDESFYVAVTPSLIAAAISKIKHMRQDLIDFGLDREKYYCKPSKLCDYCSFSDRCGKEEIENGKKD